MLIDYTFALPPHLMQNPSSRGTRPRPPEKGERGWGSCSGVPGSALGVIKYSKRIFYVTIAQIRARRCRPLATAYGAGPRSDRGPTHTFILCLYCIRILYCVRARPENIIPEVVSV